MKVILDITPRITDLFECPNCNNSIYKHVTDPKNVIGESGRYDRWTDRGFERVRDYYYKCPYCGEKVYWTSK